SRGALQTRCHFDDVVAGVGLVQAFDVVGAACSQGYGRRNKFVPIARLVAGLFTEDEHLAGLAAAVGVEVNITTLIGAKIKEPIAWDRRDKCAAHTASVQFMRIVWID